MEIEVLRSEKNEIEVQTDNLTVAEVLRVYLNEQGVDFAAWRRDHPSEPVIFLIKASNPKKAVKDAVAAIKKDLESFETKRTK